MLTEMQDAQYNALLDAFYKERQKCEKLEREVRDLKNKISQVNDIINEETE